MIKLGLLPASSSPGPCVYYTWCADKILPPGPCQTRRQIHKDTWLIVSVKREILNVTVSLCVQWFRMWTHFFLHSTHIAQQYMATLEPLRNLDHVLKAWLRLCHLVLIVAPVYTWHYFHLNFCRWWVLSLYWNTPWFTIFSTRPTEKGLCENVARKTRQIRL